MTKKKKTRLTEKLRRSVMDFLSSRLDLADLREAENKAGIAVRDAFEAWVHATIPPEDLAVLRKYPCVTREATHLNVYADGGELLPDTHVEAELRRLVVLRSWVRWPYRDSHARVAPRVVVDLSEIRNSGYDVSALNGPINEWLTAISIHRAARWSYMADVEALLSASKTLESVVEVLPVVSEMPLPSPELQSPELDDGVKTRLSAWLVGVADKAVSLKSGDTATEAEPTNEGGCHGV